MLSFIGNSLDNNLGNFLFSDESSISDMIICLKKYIDDLKTKGVEINRDKIFSEIGVTNYLVFLKVLGLSNEEISTDISKQLKDQFHKCSVVFPEDWMQTRIIDFYVIPKKPAKFISLNMIVSKDRAIFEKDTL